MKIEIKNRWTNAVIYSGDHENIKQAVLAAIAAAANLRTADLCGANLRAANLRAADLSGADLCGANLRAANLRTADLCGANLRAADLCGANLRGADLRTADLCGADLRAANLSGADLCAKEGTLNPKISIGFDVDPELPLKVARAALGEGALNMGEWHSCNTTHCLAGWAVHLSGPAGYALEKVTSPSVAGSILCPAASHLFFGTNDQALEWCRETVAKAEAASA
jgi:hypothetical protein